MMTRIWALMDHDTDTDTTVVRYSKSVALGVPPGFNDNSSGKFAIHRVIGSLRAALEQQGKARPCRNRRL